MALSWAQDALAVASGGAVGFSLGLIGGGGSILAVPLLLYVVGIDDAHVAIGTTAVPVIVAEKSGNCLIPNPRPIVGGDPRCGGPLFYQQDSRNNKLLAKGLFWALIPRRRAICVFDSPAASSRST